MTTNIADILLFNFEVTDWKKGHRLEHKEEQEEDVTG